MINDRKILIIIILISIVACSQSKKEKSYSDNHPLTSDVINMYSSILIGHWTMCSMSNDDGSSTTANQCPEIIFKINGTAEILMGTTLEETKTWTIMKDTLYMHPLALYDNRTSPSWFTDVKFVITRSEDKALINVQLKQSEKKYSYNLVREKTGVDVNFTGKRN